MYYHVVSFLVMTTSLSYIGVISNYTYSVSATAILVNSILEEAWAAYIAAVKAVVIVCCKSGGKGSREDILALINALDDHYLANAAFLMHRTTLTQLQQLRDNNGRFIWQAAISAAMPETLFGMPVLCASDMPKFANGKTVIALADFKAAYKIVDRLGLSLMRDPYTEKPFVKFYSVKRVGGDVVDNAAIKLLKI